MITFRTLSIVGLAVWLSPVLRAQPSPAPQSPPQALADTALEDLMNVEVVSVSRKEQKLSRTAAAIFVITQEEIHRSGAANIPDVLRMAPGVDVARVDANAWAVSIRGFNGRYSNKILVLIDGRSISSPVFSGVYWDQLHVPLENIERIEVIRGPGGTAWGANAMNGVINIITKGSSATQGGVILAEAGSQESGSLAQYGGKAGKTGTWRAFGRYSNTSSAGYPAGGAAADGWHAFEGGFRSDFDPSPRDKVTVQGDIYQSAEGQTLTTVLSAHLPTVATFNEPITVGSGDLQARWNHTLRNGSDISLNLYYDHFNRLEQGVDENSKSFNIDFQHHVAPNPGNDVVWGFTYRLTNDQATPGYSKAFLPPERTDSLYSVFVQDEIKLSNSAWLTVGTKLEHNSYTGFEYEPSAQFVWTPTARQTLWLSAAQAIRQPSRQDTDLQFDAAVVPLQRGTFAVIRTINNKNIQAERLRDFEAGYRVQITKRLSLDVAAFRSFYHHLETTELAAPFVVGTPLPPHVIFPVNLIDRGSARNYGGEIFATWNVSSRWRLSPGYSLIHMNVMKNSLDAASAALPNTPSDTAGNTPKHQMQFRSTLGLRANLDWDTSLYFVGRLKNEQIPSYTRLDMQLRWRVFESIEADIVGQNLLSSRHAEFGDAYGVDHTLVQRSVLGRVTWRF